MRQRLLNEAGNASFCSKYDAMRLLGRNWNFDIRYMWKFYFDTRDKYLFRRTDTGQYPVIRIGDFVLLDRAAAISPKISTDARRDIVFTERY